jgi:hypothetical protein
MMRAVILVPDDDEDRDRWARMCLDDCERAGLAVTQLVVGTGAAAWDQAMSVIEAHLAEVIVVARREHVPPDRVPQLRVVAEQPATPPRRRRLLRPRVIDR